jgi:hypothetical protein
MAENEAAVDEHMTDEPAAVKPNADLTAVDENTVNDADEPMGEDDRRGDLPIPSKIWHKRTASDKARDKKGNRKPEYWPICCKSSQRGSRCDNSR